MAEMRSAGLNHSTGASDGCDTGLPSSATILIFVLDADRLSMAERAAVDREEIVRGLVALLQALFERGEHCFLRRLAQCGIAVCRGQEIQWHLGARQEWPELLENEKHFAVIGAPVMLRLDVNEPHLSAVKPGGEVGTGAEMTMVEPETRRARQSYCAGRRANASCTASKLC